MDKRVAYIAVGLLVILYVVNSKIHPELLQELQTKVVGVWHDRSARTATAESQSDQWDKHRADVLASRVAESKRRAIAKYPSLGMADSEMNIRFVYRYRWMVKDDNPRLHTPNWPELLADECADASRPANSGPKVTAAVKPEKPGAHPAGAQGNAAVAVR